MSISAGVVADGDSVYRHLRVLEERLRDLPFRRVHRNAIVNVDHVRKMSPMSGQRWLLTLSNGQEFIVSKCQAHSVRDIWRW